MKYSVREIASMNDVQAITTLGAMFHQECRPELDFNVDMVRLYCAQCLSDNRRETLNVFICEEENEGIIGILVATRTNYLFSSQHVVNQELLYVHPAHRGHTPAKRLVRLLEDWAFLGGAVEIYTGVAVHDDKAASRLSRLLSRLGYKHVGHYHMKGLYK